MLKNRLQILRKEMQNKQLDLLLLTRSEDVFYISGYCSPVEGLPVVLIIPLAGEPVIILAEHELEAAKQTSWVKEYRTYIYYSLNIVPALDEQIAELVVSVIQGFGFPHRKVGIEGFYMPVKLFEALKMELKNPEFIDFTSILKAMQTVKSKEEIEAIRRAVRICDVGQEAVMTELREGVSEIELSNKARLAMETAVGEPLLIGSDLVSGQRTEEGGGAPDNRKLCVGDLVLSDIFPRINGYWGDTTRSFCVGRFTEKQKEIYRIIVESLYRGIAIIRQGVRASYVDREVRSCIDSKGYGEYFPHHTGHGIGITHLEAPLIIPDNDCELRAGMVLALEPGIYIPGQWGIKIEEDVLVTDNGAEVLSKQKLEVS